ncbi:MAG: glycosyltransferase family 4 protein [Paludibacteraceae bacterium]|nr:glycosyltransferase family 4 protein [Paludibacteraceae bacterium]
MNRKKKLAFVGNSSTTMHNFRMGVMKELAKSDEYEVVVLAPQDNDIKDFRDNNIRFIPIDIECKGMNPFSDIKLVNQLKKIYKKEHFDLVFHYTIKPVIYGSWAARLAGVPQISVITGLGYAFISKGWINKLVIRMYRSSLKSAKEVWFLNQEDKIMFIEKEIVSAHKTRILNGEGVNLKKYAPRPAHKSKNFSFLFVGRVLWDKGVGEFVEAARVVRKQYPHVCFRLLGPLGANNPASISQEQMEKWVHAGVVKYLGETHDVVPYITDASCIVLPSYREGISRVLLEAAAMEKPIITSNVPGCREIVIDGVNGFLCEPQNASSLIACMMHMLSISQEERDIFGKNGREHVLKYYDEDITIQVYKDKLNNLFC